MSTPGRSGAQTTPGASQRTWWSLSLLAIAVSVVIAVVTVNVSGPSTRESDGGDRRFLRGDSCVYTSHSLAGLASYEDLTGRTSNCAVLFGDAVETWDGIAEPWFLRTKDPDFQWERWVAQKPGRFLVIAVPLVPADPPSDWRERGAAGEYDRWFTRLGENLRSAGLSRSVIRLAHEANGDWKADEVGDSAADRRAWRAYWARAARALKAVPGTDFVLDLSLNAGFPQVPLEQYYPGDAAVDVIGIDQYDGFLSRRGPTDPPERWERMRTQANGLDVLLRFARSRGKPVSFPEWGLAAPDEGGLGDNPYFVSRMRCEFARSDLAYEAYWNKIGAPSDLSSNPRSLGVMRQRTVEC